MAQMWRHLSDARGGEKLLSVLREYHEKKGPVTLKAILERKSRGDVQGDEEKKSEVLGDGERERLRGLAGSCSSVVARERHVTCCLATLSN